MRYVFGDYILDTQRRELRCRGHAVPVRPKVFDLLVYLIMHHDRAVSKQALLTHLWPNLHVSLTSLSDCIRLARQAVGDSGATQHVIQTLHGRGYRFVAPVEAQEQVPPANQPQPGLPPAEPVLVLAPTPAHAAAAADTSSIVRHTANGEYKPVTVLCCGIADALLLAARLGSEAMYRLMQAVFGLVQEVMRHYEGTMTHHTSESFTAVFGVPVAQEDHARWAVLAAFELHQRLRTDPALHAHTSGEVSSSARDSHSGLVVVGDLGTTPQRLYTAVGDPTSLATHLQHRAPPGTILMSVATYRLVHEEVQVEAGTPLDIDGRSTPVQVYALLGLLRRSAGVPGRSPQAWSPFVGRERELALLHERLAAATAGQGQVVGLVGEPGMGKTRLLTEFRRHLSGSQVTYYAGQCLSYGQATPYHPVRDMLQQICAITQGHDTAASAAVRQRLQDMDVGAAEDVALVLQVLDLPVAPEALTSLHPQERKARTFALLRHLILHAAQRQPLALAVENLHFPG